MYVFKHPVYKKLSAHLCSEKFYHQMSLGLVSKFLIKISKQINKKGGRCFLFFKYAIQKFILKIPAYFLYYYVIDFFKSDKFRFYMATLKSWFPIFLHRIHLLIAVVCIWNYLGMPLRLYVILNFFLHQSRRKKYANTESEER